MTKTIVFAACAVLLAAGASAVGFDQADPVWTTAEKGEVNSSVAFVSGFDWDGVQPLKLRLTGCSIFKVFVNGEFAAYGPARGPHGWFRMDEWDLSRVAKKGRNHLTIEGVAYNTTTYYIIDHAPFLQAEVLAGGKVVRATGDGQWMAVPTSRVRQVPRYSLQRAQSEVYEVNHLWDAARRSVDGWNPVTLKIEKQPPVKLLERGAPYPKFEMDRTYRPTTVLGVSVRTGDLGKEPNFWDEKTSFLGKTYSRDELKYIPALEWWKRGIEAKSKGEVEQRRIDSSCGVRFAGAINDTGFLRLKVKVEKPGRILVGFDEILVGGKLDFLSRFGCNNIVMWDVKEPGEYEFESFEPYTFKYAEVIMLEGEATVETLEMRTYKNPNATRACTLADPADRKIFEAARETFAQNAVDVFTDCPSRERAGWLCDSYFTGPAEHFFTGKNEIERTFLRNFALAEEFPHLPEGMVAMCYPGDHVNKNYIPNWSMWFVLEIANYFERTGDRETVDLLKPRVEGLLKFYAKYLNRDGLLENLPAWVFVEWSHANDSKLVKSGVNWPSNMTYSDVLLAAAKLYGKDELRVQGEKLKAAIRERSFDGTWFRDNDRQPDVTETCQYYAFFHGIATPKTHPELWKKLTEEFGPERQEQGLYKEVWPSNAFIGNLMRLIVLDREGLTEQMKREVRGYYLKMAVTTGTLWEHDRPEASCNHGFASYVAVLLTSSGRGGERAPLIVNEPAEHFFVATSKPRIDQEAVRTNAFANLLDFRLSADIDCTERGAERYVDALAGGSMTHLFINVNYQRSFYPSQVIEPIWTALDGENPSKSPFVRSMKESFDRGFDAYAVMMRRCRERGVSPWLSFRMNDIHGTQTKSDPMASTFWREHPEWHLNDDGGWENGLDYAEKAVRDRMAAYIREAVTRYDTDGVELDFIRFPHYFRKGTETGNAPLLTAFIREIRETCNRAAGRRSHPVKIAVRLLPDPEQAAKMGADVGAWARENLVDLVIVCNMFGSIEYEYRLNDWRKLLGGGVRIVAGTDNGIVENGKRRILNLGEYRHWIELMRRDGADGVYFFNFALRPYLDETWRGILGR